MAKKIAKCWCGFKPKSNQGLSIHKNRQGHWFTPEEQEANRRRSEQAEEASRKTVSGYIQEVSESLANGRHLQVGDKVRIERVGVIKEIIITGENTTVDVRIDVITRVYKSL